MIDLLLWVIVGSVMGWVASLVMTQRRSRESSAFNMGVGVAGAALGGWLLSPLIGVHMVHPELFSLGALLVAVVASALLLIVVNVVRGSTSR